MKDSLTETSKLRKVLKTLCILTFIGSACTLLMCIYLSLMNTPFVQEFYSPHLEKSGNAEAFYKLYEHATSIGIIKAVLSGLSIFGAVLMYNAKRNGLYIYAFAQIAILFVSPIINGRYEFKFMEPGLVVLWVTMYAVVFYLISRKEKLAV